MADDMVTQFNPAAKPHGAADSDLVVHVKPSIAASARVNADTYHVMQNHAANDPDHFWAEEAKRIPWISPPSVIKNTSFTGDVAIKWFEDGTLNASAVCLDAHLKTRGDQTAIIWEGDDPNASRHISYRELHEQVCRFANVLKSLGVKKGDRVTIYLPMVPEAAISMLACARVGAIHSVVADREPIGHDLVTVMMAETDPDERDPGQEGREAEQRRGQDLGRAVAELAPEQAGEEAADERQKNDGVIHGASAQPFIMLMSSTAIVPRFR